MGNETASFWAGIKKYEDILARDPHAYSFAPLAEIYRKLDLPDEALRIARRGVALHPEFAAGQMVLACASLDKSLTEEAKQALEAVVRITPENLVAQQLLADLYLSAGDAAAADRCLQIIADLNPVAPEETAPAATPIAPHLVAEQVPMAPAMPSEAVTLAEDEEILDLTDDLIEEDVFEEEPYTPFAAAPERPSLLAGRESETITAVPQQVVASSVPETPSPERAVSSSVDVAAEEVVQPPVLTATIAELYVSQGLLAEGIGVYRELLRENPNNAAYRERYRELTGTPSAVATIAAEPAPDETAAGTIEAPPRDPVTTMEGWLGNIRRIRECRTEMH
jgi:tetratricopeptide (TPR) repeat protein